MFENCCCFGSIWGGGELEVVSGPDVAVDLELEGVLAGVEGAGGHGFEGMGFGEGDGFACC